MKPASATVNRMIDMRPCSRIISQRNGMDSQPKRKCQRRLLSDSQPAASAPPAVIQYQIDQNGNRNATTIHMPSGWKREPHQS